MPLQPVPRQMRLSPARRMIRSTLERAHCQRCASSFAEMYGEGSSPSGFRVVVRSSVLERVFIRKEETTRRD